MYSFSSRVRFSEVDCNQELTLHSVLNYFQDCSTFHSAAAHMDIDELTEYGYAWLLASWQVVINRRPKLGEEVVVKTWPYNFKGFLGYRNFTLEDRDGNVCAYANTLWTFLNLSTMHPAKILPDVAEAYPLSPQFPMETAPRKIVIVGEETPLPPWTVMKHHIDVNQHVNNSMYILMAQEYLPDDFPILQMRTEYKNAATLGDQVYPYIVDAGDIFQVIMKDADNKAFAIIEFTRR